MKSLDHRTMWERFVSEMDKVNSVLKDVGDEHMSVNEKREGQNVPKVMFVGSDEEALRLIGARIEAEYLFVDAITCLFEASSVDKLIAQVEGTRPALLWIDMPKALLREMMEHIECFEKHIRVHIVPGFFAHYAGMK